MPESHLLVVEDDPAVALHIERMVSRLGYRPTLAASSEAAFAAVEGEIPDLVLMDIGLPGPMDGIDTAIRLRRRSTVPVVFLTGYTDDATLERAKATDPYGYLAKPFDETSLRFVVEVALNRFAADQRLEREILEIGDRERARIGQDLHDGLGQILGGVAFLAKTLEEKLAARGAEEAVEASRLVKLLEQGVSEARRIARGLFPRELESQGLANALKDLAALTAEVYRVVCTVEVDDLETEQAEVARHLYRIAQEAVSNALKHGRAGRIEIRLARDERWLSLTVADDGSGIGSASGSNGMGLHLMRYRAQVLGGSLAIEEIAPHGTLVRCSCPRRPA